MFCERGSSALIVRGTTSKVSRMAARQYHCGSIWPESFKFIASGIGISTSTSESAGLSALRV